MSGETPADVEVEVDDDPLASTPFPGAEGIPVCVTFLQVRATDVGRAQSVARADLLLLLRLPPQVGEHSLVDARWQEEACADARVRVAVNRWGSTPCEGGKV